MRPSFVAPLLRYFMKGCSSSYFAVACSFDNPAYARLSATRAESSAESFCAVLAVVSDFTEAESFFSVFAAIFFFFAAVAAALFVVSFFLVVSVFPANDESFTGATPARYLSILRRTLL